MFWGDVQNRSPFNFDADPKTLLISKAEADAEVKIEGGFPRHIH